MTIAKAIARAWTDADYKAKMLSDAPAALAEVGVDIPVGTAVIVVEDTAASRHLVLPAAPPEAGEMSMEDLEKVAGGTGNSGSGNIGFFDTGGF